MDIIDWWLVFDMARRKKLRSLSRSVIFFKLH